MNQRELFLRYVAQTSDLPMLGIDINIEKASGVKLHDKSGKEFIDLISGISVSSIGHCHPHVVEAVKRQTGKFMHLMVYGEYNQQPQVRYAQALAAVLPPKLQSVFFTTGGSEAVEGAVKLSKKATGRAEIISFRNAYHGSTQGALSLMGDEFFRNRFRPLVPGGRLLPFNNIEALHDISDRTAAVIIEPIQGEAGVRKADKLFLEALRKKCSEHGALLIFDEIQCGFGRTGTMFAFEQFGVVPDILLLAKGMGGGMPIGAFVASAELMSELSRDPVLGHINTFGGNAVCVAAAMACLEVLIRDRLYERAFQIEQIIRRELQHPLIKDLRIHGAIGAIDFHNEPFNMKVIKACLENGIITDWFLFCTSAMRIAPPLVISDSELITSLGTLKHIIGTL